MTASSSTPPLNAAADGTAWWRLWSLLVVPAVLGLVSLTRGLRAEYLLAGALFVALAWVGPRARRFSLLALPFVLTGLLYDHFGLLLGLRGEIHVSDLHGAELALFGVSTAAGKVSLAELFSTHHTPWLDVPTGFAYMVYLFEVMGVTAWLYFRDTRRTAKLAWGFFVANLIGMVVWLAWPAAPPWYVMEYGLGPAQLDALPSAAGAARFDELLGIGWFEGFYARNVNVFGAMPSLHTAYPVLVTWATWPLGWGWRAATGLFALLVGFSAVYLSHHYVLDVLAGALTGALAWVAALALFHRSGLSSPTQAAEAAA